MEILGFDIDGVLYPWQVACYEHLMLYYNYKGTYDELWGTDDFNEFVANKGQMFADNLIRIQTLYSTFPPQKKDMKSLRNLANNYEIVYITNRPKDVEFVTRNFFMKYDYPNYDNIIFTNNKIRDIRFCGCDYFIEDRPTYCLSLQDMTNLIMMTQPWNISIRGKIKNQIQNLQDLERILL